MEEEGGEGNEEEGGEGNGGGRSLNLFQILSLLWCFWARSCFCWVTSFNLVSTKPNLASQLSWFWARSLENFSSCSSKSFSNCWTPLLVLGQVFGEHLFLLSHLVLQLFDIRLAALVFLGQVKGHQVALVVLVRELLLLCHHVVQLLLVLALCSFHLLLQT
ncbi:hypothetical protein F7725_014978 [Dissostichus mawsoni]|uniref:Uncharacterized protein n=1 Tax=Dissostichus mawsoni TaxID=36200 RepID=A0A7J5YHP5_DISMA|nr:hypothetical protein F7725_014978 [Dissostichus mawsoni]